jgi:hypothetical protein
MRRLFFDEILLLSNQARAGRRMKLHPKAVVIKGENDTGKSSLIKSLYWTLGADPAQQHTQWRDLGVRGLLHFRVDDKRYSILRNGSQFTVFDDRGELQQRCNSVTQELGPYLAGLLNFRLTLVDRQGASVTPPPAFMFAPFYIDQDQGWSRNLSSFGKLGQFARWQEPLVEYYAGVRSNAYYEAQAQITKATREMIAPQSKATALELSKKLVQQSYPPAFEIDVDAYKKQIDELIAAAQTLQAEREKCRQKMTGLGNDRVRILSQIEIVKKVATEIDGDYEFATHKLEEAHVDCPLCGAVYENNFRDRFSIAQDLGRCGEFEESLNEELATVERQLKEARDELNVANASYEEARKLLTEKQKQVTLQDLINNEARRKVETVIDVDLQACRSELREIQGKQDAASAALKASEDSKRRRDIIAEYQAFMRRFLVELDVQTLDEKAYAKLYSRISETGSDLPRAILAYQFAILKVAFSRGSSPFCPVVIDSPNQQDQDPENYKRMLTFIQRTMDPGSQLILGAVEDLGIDFGGALLDLEAHKFGALRREQYEEVFEEVQPYMRRSVGARES